MKIFIQLKKIVKETFGSVPKKVSGNLTRQHGISGSTTSLTGSLQEVSMLVHR